MNKGLFLGGIFFVFLLVGTLSNAFGITAPVMEIPTQEQSPTEISDAEFENPDDESWMNSLGRFFASIGRVAAFFFNAIGAIFQIMTFQVDIPAMANLLIVGPILFIVVYLGLTLLRGGS